MNGTFGVLIVGTGHAGAQAAATLRQRGFAGMVGEEPELPYERPPLSKDYLAGDKPLKRILLRPSAGSTACAWPMATCWRPIR